MKKFVMFLLLLLAMPVMMFAQDVVPVVTDIDWTHLKEYFVSLTALSGLVIAVAAIVLRYIKDPSALVKQLISIGVALILSLVGWLFGWGIFEGVPWWQMLLYGLAAGFGSNGGWDLIKAILRLVGLMEKK